MSPLRSPDACATEPRRTVRTSTPFERDETVTPMNFFSFCGQTLFTLVARCIEGDKPNTIPRHVGHVGFVRNHLAAHTSHME